MTGQEFKAELTKAFKTHMFMKDREHHTVNELLYVLEHHDVFNGDDFNISIKLLNGIWWSIPCMDAFVTISTRSVWFNDYCVEFDIEDVDGLKFNCITVYETLKEEL